MVVRANQAYGELGGHIASYASAAEIFEVGFNHFFARLAKHRAAIWCSISRIPRPAFMRGLSLRAGSMKNSGALPAGNRRAWAVLVSASLAHAGVLAISDRLDGHRSDQFRLPGALHALSRTSRAQGLRRSTRVGRFW